MILKNRNMVTLYRTIKNVYKFWHEEEKMSGTDFLLKSFPYKQIRKHIKMMSGLYFPDNIEYDRSRLSISRKIHYLT